MGWGWAGNPVPPPTTLPLPHPPHATHIHFARMHTFTATLPTTHTPSSTTPYHHRLPPTAPNLAAATHTTSHTVCRPTQHAPFMSVGTPAGSMLTVATKRILLFLALVGTNRRTGRAHGHCRLLPPPPLRTPCRPLPLPPHPCSLCNLRVPGTAAAHSSHPPPPSSALLQPELA